MTAPEAGESGHAGQLSTTIVARAAVAAYIKKDDQILLIRRSNAPAAGEWALPGGKIKPGETMQAALEREILEETGLEVEVVGPPLHVFDSIHYDTNQELKFHYVIIDFAATILGGKLVAGDDAREIGWFSARQLHDITLNASTAHFLNNIVHFM